MRWVGVALAACSQRTRRIRLGHGIVLMPPGYNHPARVAERIATLDLVSGGRVEFGTGESASRAELEGFGIDPAERRAMWRETVEQVANMMAMDHYVFGTHTPGRTNIWDRFVAVRDQIGTEVLGAGTGCIGAPAELRETLQTFAEAGVDQTVFIQQGGRNRHEHICESLELFAAEVMPAFREGEAERERRKMEELAPFIEAAFARKPAPPPAPDEARTSYRAYGMKVAEDDLAKLPEGNRRRIQTFQKIREIAERAGP